MASSRFLSCTLLAVLLTANAGMSQTPARNSKETSPADRQYRMQQDQAEARKLVDTLATSIEDLSRLFREAKASNDKQRMKDALDAGIAHLAYMKVSADKCKKRMEGMEMKMEGMEGHKGMKKHASADSSQVEAPAGDAPKRQAGDAHQGH